MTPRPDRCKICGNPEEYSGHDLKVSGHPFVPPPVPASVTNDKYCPHVGGFLVEGVICKACCTPSVTVPASEGDCQYCGGSGDVELGDEDHLGKVESVCLPCDGTGKKPTPSVGDRGTPAEKDGGPYSDNGKSLGSFHYKISGPGVEEEMLHLQLSTMKPGKQVIELLNFGFAQGLSAREEQLREDARRVREIAHWAKLVEMEFKRADVSEIRRKEARVISENLYNIADRVEPPPALIARVKGEKC